MKHNCSNFGGEESCDQCLRDLKVERQQLKDAHLEAMRHLVERTRERDAALLQIDELKRQSKVDVQVMGEISKCRDEAFLQLGEMTEDRDAWTNVEALLQISELQEIVHLAVDLGGENFHEEACPGDDTCECPDPPRVNKAMEGFVSKRPALAPLNLPVAEKRIEVPHFKECSACGAKAVTIDANALCQDCGPEISGGIGNA